MGGTLIIFSLTFATVLLADISSWYVWLALLVTLSNGLIGFLDDSAKVRRRNSRGPAGRARLSRGARDRRHRVDGDLPLVGARRPRDRCRS
jgi:phospho-N-acetylmuramoyl-pentapeptide-transferase